jgi:hypothetical protein
LVPCNPQRVCRVFFFDDSVARGVLQHIHGFLLGSIDEPFKACGSNGRHDLSMPEKIIRLGEFLHDRKIEAGGDGGGGR